MATFPRRILLGVVWIVACVSATPLVSPAHARTVYVRQSGNDDNDGLSPSSAVRTIGKGAMLATAGDTVLVGPGTYQEGDIRPAPFGRVRFQADRRGIGVGDPPGNVVVDATGFATGFEFNGQLAMAVDGFVVFGARIGIYVKSGSHGAVVSNNIVFDSNDNGVYVHDSRDAVVFNNLTYKNLDSGILVRGQTQSASGARILSNTAYANRQRGIFVTGPVSSPNVLVLNNIVQSNGNAGIQVNSNFHTGYLSAGNVSFDNRLPSDTPIDVTDLEADPLFVDPAGPDGILGGSGYADDDFHLSQERSGQTVTSPAIDHGSDLSRRLGLLRASTRTDGKPDRGFVDSGFHYNSFASPPAAPAQRLRFEKIWVSAAAGNDANDGATRETAVRTIKKAFSLVKPGNQIMIVGGTYDEGQLSLRTSGQPGRPIVIKALNGARIAGSAGTSGLALNSVAHIVVDGLHVSGAGQDGIEINFSQVAEDSDNIVLRRVRLTGNARRGLSLKSAAGVRMVASVIDGNLSRGVLVEGAALTIDRCKIRNNAETGVWAILGSSVAISGTEISGNIRDGVLVEQSELSLVGGSIRGSADGGVRFKGSSIGFLEGVDVVDNGDVGVQAISSVVSVSGGNVRSNGVGLQAFVDPVAQLPVELDVDGTRICENRLAGIDAQQATVMLSAIDLCANAQEGLSQRGGTLDLTGGKIRSNSRSGIFVADAQRVLVQNAIVGSNIGNGVQVDRAASLAIEDSVLHDNHLDGLIIMDTPAAEIVNNLAYGNAASGIRISGVAMGSQDATVISNTVYGNGNRGLFIGGSTGQPPSQNAVVFRNIFSGNANAGVQINITSQIGHRVDYNLSTDPYGGNMEPGVHDIIGPDPLFVNPDAGDFHLSQTAAGQSRSSPAVNGGDVSAASVGMNTKTTRTDKVADTGVVDLGYHYPP